MAPRNNDNTEGRIAALESKIEGLTTHVIALTSTLGAIGFGSVKQAAEANQAQAAGPNPHYQSLDQTAAVGIHQGYGYAQNCASPPPELTIEERLQAVYGMAVNLSSCVVFSETIADKLSPIPSAGSTLSAATKGTGTFADRLDDIQSILMACYDRLENANRRTYRHLFSDK